ncbi:MAG: ribosome recycling factor [Acidimicrobiaceae bacterium]|nr:ribosome recycling factor [Acidimicrobiaceae bacterium]
MSEELIGMVLADAGERMDEAVAAAKRDFSTVRTGRASSALLERVQVEAYGVRMAMRELVSFAIPEASQLIITPHDPANINAVERAIQQAQLGLVPSNDGRVIRLSFPPLTEERRRDLARLVGSMAEDSRNRIRGLRRQARKDLEGIEKDGGVSADVVTRAGEQLDDLTRAHEQQVDRALASKEDELLEV